MQRSNTKGFSVHDNGLCSYPEQVELCPDCDEPDCDGSCLAAYYGEEPQAANTNDNS